MSLVFTVPHARKTIRLGLPFPKFHTYELGAESIGSKLLDEGYKVFINKTSLLDPNYHTFSSFRHDVYTGQTHNIDLHQMRNKHGYDLILGFGSTVDDISSIEAYCKKNNVYVLADQSKFAAKNPRTITSYLETKGVKAIQIEMSGRFIWGSKRAVEHIKTIADLFSNI